MVEFLKTLDALEQWNGDDYMRKYQIPGIQTKGCAHSAVEEIQLMFNLIFNDLVSSGYFRRCSTNDSDFRIHAVYEYSGQKENKDSDYYVSLSENDKYFLINHATAIYLSEWLACDENAKQTINSFAVKKYCAIDEIQKRKRGAEMKAGKRSLYNRAAQKYRDMMLLQQLRAKEEGRNCKPADFILYRQENDSDSLNTPKAGLPYSFSELCFIDWIAEYNFTLYDLLVYSTDFMRKSNEDRNAAIKDAYQHYFNAIEELKSTEDDRLYTISSIMIQQIEGTFGHMAAATLARFFEFCPNLNTEDHICNTEFFWARLEYTPFRKREGGPVTDYPYLFWSYYGIAQYLSLKETDAQTHAAMHLLLSRGLLTEMLMYANICMHPSRRRSWTAEDYHHAANFFRKQHPIVERHSSLELAPPNEWTHKECDFIRSFYEKMFPDGLEQLRTSSQKTRKERNLRYNNKRQPT